MHKARELPKEEFRREVEKELTGKESEPAEIIYFKLYKSQIPVVEQAIETAALMLGTDKSPCEDVLNHRHCEQGVLDPGESVEGILLAHTLFERIPFEYLHGFTAPAELSVTDQYGRRHWSPIEISIDRRARCRRECSGRAVRAYSTEN